MPFCPKCGEEYTDGTKFCGKCGADLAPVSAAAASVTPVKSGPSFIDKLMNTSDRTDTMDTADINTNKILAILAYCASFVYIVVAWFFGTFFALIFAAAVLVAPLIIARKSEFTAFHCSEALTLLFGTMIVEIIESTIASFFFSVLLRAFASWSNWDAGVIPGTIVAWFIHLIFMAIPVLLGVAGIVNSAKGKAKDLPLIGKIKVILDK